MFTLAKRLTHRKQRRPHSTEHANGILIGKPKAGQAALWRQSLRNVLVAVIACRLLASCGAVLGAFAFGAIDEQRALEQRCEAAHGVGWNASRSDVVATLADERVVATFEPTIWSIEYRPQYAGPKYSGPATHGRLVITDAGVVFVPYSDSEKGGRFPASSIWHVEIRRWAATAEARAVSVDSCGVRHDVFTFPSTRVAGQLDPETTARAAALIPSRF
jgi:hypothetical protein